MMKTLGGATLMVFVRDSRGGDAGEGELVIFDRVRDLSLDMKIGDEPSLEQLREAVAMFLPGKFRLMPRYLPNPDSPRDWLIHVLGIACVVKIGSDRFAWSPSTDRVEAEGLLRAYSSQPYSLVRRALGIRYHWIMLLDPQLLTTPGDIVESYSQFVDAGADECAIVRC